MPAAAVIPAPIAYIKVVAVKTLVVGPRSALTGRASALVPVGVCLLLSGRGVWGLDWFRALIPAGRPFTVKKVKCSKQANALNM